MEMNKLKQKLLVIALVTVLLAQFAVSKSYIVMKPGLSIDLAEVVRVEGGSDKAGQNLMTAVNTSRASLIDILLSFFREEIQLIPVEEYLPRGISINDYTRIMDRMMKESQVVSKVVALRRLGYDIDVKNSIVVEKLLPDSPASGILMPGDRIISIGGKEIYSLQGAVNAIQSVEPGELITVRFSRDGEVFEKEVRTTADISSKGEETTALKVIISSEPVSDLPVDIEIDLKKVGGSSAGLMMCLEIMDQLSPEGINGGFAIAGTGTIDFEGRVGPISGVRQKITAAKREGAKYFLIPRENLSDAGESIEGMELIGVESIDEALSALEEIKRKNRILAE